MTEKKTIFPLKVGKISLEKKSQARFSHSYYFTQVDFKTKFPFDISYMGIEVQVFFLLFTCQKTKKLQAKPMLCTLFDLKIAKVVIFVYNVLCAKPKSQNNAKCDKKNIGIKLQSTLIFILANFFFFARLYCIYFSILLLSIRANNKKTILA